MQESREASKKSTQPGQIVEREDERVDKWGRGRGRAVLPNPSAARGAGEV